MRGQFIDLKAFYRLPFEERMGVVWRRTEEYHALFMSAKTQADLEEYQEKHPTAQIDSMCSDGRVTQVDAMGAPLGYTHRFRTIGSKFSFRNPAYAQAFSQVAHDAFSEGRKVLAKFSYHKDRRHTHLGCAGFENNTKAAMERAFKLVRQARDIYASCGDMMNPIAIGFCTDDGGLIVHSEDFQTELDIAQEESPTEAFFREWLREHHPSMPLQVRLDCALLFMNDWEYAHRTRSRIGLQEVRHAESIGCLGYGFESMMPLIALILGPFSNTLDDEIKRFGEILLANVVHGEVPNDGTLLLVSWPYRKGGTDRKQAEYFVDGLVDRACRVLKEKVPGLYERLWIQRAVKYWPHRKLIRLGEMERAV